MHEFSLLNKIWLSLANVSSVFHDSI